nr:hypothetical protein [Candidatus Sigynarchaeota archaeon]
MSIFDVIAWILYPLFIIFQVSSGIYLLARAIKTRIYAVLFLTISSIFYVLDVIVTDLRVPAPTFVRYLIMMNYPLCYVLFTKYTFYKDRKSHFTAVLSISIALRVVHFIELNIFNETVPATSPVSLEKLGAYFFHLMILTCMHSLAMGYFINASRIANKNAKGLNFEPWIAKRNMWIGISGGIYAILPAMWYLIPIDGNGYVSPQGVAVGVTVLSIFLAQSSINLLCWVMPPFFKSFLNKGFVAPQGETPKGLPTDITPLMQKILTTREMMGIVDYLGRGLASKIQKTPSAAKGLLLMVFQEHQEKLGTYALVFSELKNVIATTLKSYLVRMGIKDADAITSEMQDELAKNQAMLVMMTI